MSTTREGGQGLRRCEGGRGPCGSYTTCARAAGLCSTSLVRGPGHALNRPNLKTTCHNPLNQGAKTEGVWV